MLGDRLKLLRSTLHKSQDEIANYLGMSRSSYSHIENNRNQPDIDTIIKLSKYYGVSADYLLGTNSENNSDEFDINKYIEKINLKKFIDDNINKGIYYGSGPITDEQKKQLEIALKMIFYEHYKGDDKWNEWCIR